MTQSNKRTFLVTSALPYANGPIHIGHMVEYIQTDIWVRAQKMLGHICYYVCADDAHGTPIMLRAQEKNIPTEELIAEIGVEHQNDFRDFAIEFDHYHTTHSPENEALTKAIFLQLKQNGHIEKRQIQQAYDPEKEMFLPDRFIRGICPKCNSADQYGDGCERCGATYDSTELKQPTSALSGATPIQKSSEHYFFKLNDHKSFLQNWLDQDILQKEVRHKLDEWLNVELKPWDISRDAPYFGFMIPDESDKYFYVWLDAPIGYLASFKALCEKRGLHFDTLLSQDSDLEIHHFIGKDIIYFHALFWPAILNACDLKLPSKIHAHGFLTIDGQKMSKSRGKFFTARKYLQALDAEYLRYYFATKLNQHITDIDFNSDDFITRVNADLIGKFVNIASRCAGFIEHQFDLQLAEQLTDTTLIKNLAQMQKQFAEAYGQRRYAWIMCEIMRLADQVNQYIAYHKPWIIAKDDARRQELQQICTVGLNCFRLLTIYLKPVLPTVAKKVEDFLKITPLTWHDCQDTLVGHKINRFKPLLTRIDKKQTKTLMDVEKANDSTNAGNESTQTKETINIDTFSKLDLKVAKIIHASCVPESDKILRLKIDLGEEERTVFAGISKAYKPEDLENRLVIAIVNLAPRKMRFGTSEAMILAAGGGNDEIYLLHPDSGAKVGMQIS